MDRRLPTGRGRAGRGALIGLAVAAAVATAVLAPGSRAAEEAKVVPAPSVDLAPEGDEAVAVLAGGCFWGVQGVFQHVVGVKAAVSGYAGGDAGTARYEAIGSGRTGHAEVVRVTYDPKRISYGRILQIHFSVAHDPTQRDRQGPDRGPQYRSAIFPTNAAQGEVAAGYIAELDKAGVYGSAIATRIEPGKTFYPAEDYHQDFMARHPRHPYIVAHDLPKVADLGRLFPGAFRADPVLVAAAR